MKLIEYKPEVTYDYSSVPQKMTVKEVLALLDEQELRWKDPEGLDEKSPELWETAKPKFYDYLAKQYPAPIIFGSKGDDLKIPHPLSNETLSRELQDIQDAHGFYVQRSWDISGINEICWLSNSFEQEHEWLERKKKCPLLTVQDLQRVDKIVDEIFEKHAGYLTKRRNNFFIPERFSSAILTDKFFGPI